MKTKLSSFFLPTTYPYPSIFKQNKKWRGYTRVVGRHPTTPPPRTPPQGHTINQSNNPRGETTTQPHPKYQNNNIDNNKMKMSKFDLES
jgi:hypothetical protein